MENVINWHRYIKTFICLLVFVFGASLFILNQDQVAPDPTTGGGDPRTYYRLATQLLEQNIYAEAWPEIPFRAWRPPLYPTFLGALLWIGKQNLHLVIFVQYTLLLLSGGLIWYLFFHLSGSFYGGTVSCILFYLYSPFYYYASFFYSETLFTFFLLLLLVAAYKAIDSGQSAWFSWAGILLTASVLTRTISLPLLILSSAASILLLLIHYGRKLDLFNPKLAAIFAHLLQKLGTPKTKQTLTPKNLLLFLGFSWLLLSLWTIRNYLVLDEFVLVNTATGLNIYFGTQTDLYRDGTGWKDELWRVSNERWLAEHENTINPLRAEMGEIGANQGLSQLAISLILENPTRFINHKLHIIYRYLIPNLNSPLHIVEGFIDFGKAESVIHILFFISIIIIVYTGKKTWVILLTVYLLLVATSSLSFFSERFVIITIPLYLMISVYGLFSIAHWLQLKQKR